MEEVSLFGEKIEKHSLFGPVRKVVSNLSEEEPLEAESVFDDAYYPPCEDQYVNEGWI